MTDSTSLEHRKLAAKPKVKIDTKPNTLHPRNVHHSRYDFSKLTKILPELSEYTTTNPKGEPTINFSDAKAVLTLNKALLALHYDVKHWDLPKGYLCPPIPGRADYIHYLADLLNGKNANDIEDGNKTKLSSTSDKVIHALDIGTGASLIYPIIGSQSYGWYFTATDIDSRSLSTAKAICELNPNLTKFITLKKQHDPQHIFKGVIDSGAYYDVTLCNPPFHASMQAVLDANRRKHIKLQQNRMKRNPNATKQVKPSTIANNLNFGGQNAELWTKGGEIGFVSQMINESVNYAKQVNWFTTLISKAENLKPLDALLKENRAKQIKTINMKHGQKTTRILAWCF